MHGEVAFHYLIHKKKNPKHPVCSYEEHSPAKLSVAVLKYLWIKAQQTTCFLIKEQRAFDGRPKFKVTSSDLGWNNADFMRGLPLKQRNPHIVCNKEKVLRFWLRFMVWIWNIKENPDPTPKPMNAMNEHKPVNFYFYPVSFFFFT